MSVTTNSRTSATHRPGTGSRPSHPSEPTRTSRHPGRRQRLVDQVISLLAAHSIDALRISLGLVILGFGSLKYVPGASPAEDLVMQTTEVLTFGLVTGTTAVVATAVLETAIGLILLTGRGLRLGLLAMAGWLVAIMTPVVLFPTEMFPGGLPTLAAQYVLKDVILVAAVAVVAAKALGARLVPPVDRVNPAFQAPNIGRPAGTSRTGTLGAQAPRCGCG